MTESMANLVSTSKFWSMRNDPAFNASQREAYQLEVSTYEPCQKRKLGIFKRASWVGTA